MDKRKLIEKRNELREKMKQIIASVEAESRCITDEEQTEFDGYRDEIANIDRTIAANEQLRELGEPESTVSGSGETEAEQRTLDEQNFLAYIRSGGRSETRSLDVSTNGGIIPQSIADRIIEEVKELSPILSIQCGRRPHFPALE